MSYLNIFSHERKSDRYYVFTEGYSTVHRFTIGVIVGRDKVLVIDSGMGMTGDLRSYIESVVGTDKPMLCALSHGSIDHAGSSILFDERFCNRRDEWMLQTQAFNLVKRQNDLVGFGLNNPEMIKYGHEHMLYPENVTFEWIDEGYVFDLGEVLVEVIALPGHSAGSLAYFDREGGYCFVGDAINIDTQVQNVDLWFNEPEHRATLPTFLGIHRDTPRLSYAECFTKYADVVRRFISLVGEDVTLYAGHTTLPQSINTAHWLAQAAQEVGEGRTEFDMPAESIFAYQMNSGEQDRRAHYAGNVCIEYDALKFRREAAAGL